MSKIYFVRHGETLFNQQKRFQGKMNTELSDKGKLQAKGVAQQLTGLNIDLIISSPKKRALQTANIINDTLKLPLITECGLRELDMGVFEGLTNEEIMERYPVMWKSHLNPKFNVAHHGGESAKDVIERVFSVLNNIKKDHYSKNILIVSHGFIGKAVYKYFNQNITNKEFFSLNLANCAINEFNF